MNWFKKIKTYYTLGMWTIDQVRNAVVAGKIIAAQFETITGEPYDQN